MCAPVSFREASVERHLVPRPEQPRETQGLEHPRDAVLAGDAERLVLLVAVAERGVDDDSPVREDVQGRDVLRHLHRVLQRDEDRRKHVHVFRLGTDAGERDERLQHLEGMGEVVLAGVDVVESEVAGDAHEVEHVGEALHHVPVAGVLEEAGEGESESHRGGSRSVAEAGAYPRKVSDRMPRADRVPARAPGRFGRWWHRLGCRCP